MVYDCNSTNVGDWTDSAQAAGLAGISVTPDYLPLSEGFLRQPNFFVSHYGAIERDMERMVDDMERLAGEAGVRPQVIVGMVRVRRTRPAQLPVSRNDRRTFPQQQVPAGVLPAQRTGAGTEHPGLPAVGGAATTVGEIPVVLTDNRSSGSLQTIDERVALCLASVEAACRYRPDMGTLAEVCSMFGLSGARWLGLESIDVPYKLARAPRPGDSGLPGRRRAGSGALAGRPGHDLRMAYSQVVQGVKEAVWRIAEPVNNEHHTGYFHAPARTSEQRVYCILPFAAEVVDEIRHDVEDQLQREQFDIPFPGTKVCFAPGNALWNGRDDFAYGHIAKIVGMPAEPLPPSLARVVGARRGVPGIPAPGIVPGRDDGFGRGGASGGGAGYHVVHPAGRGLPGGGSHSRGAGASDDGAAAGSGLRRHGGGERQRRPPVGAAFGTAAAAGASSR